MRYNKNVDDIDGLKVKVYKSVAILLFREFFIKIFGFLGQIITARILLPSEFGFFVIIGFIVNFFSIFNDIGLSPAIVREQKRPSEKELSTIFFIKLFLSIILIFIIMLLAGYVKLFFSNFTDSYVTMLRVFSLTIFLTALRSIPLALIEREICYDVISKVDIAGVLGYQIAVIIFALLGFHVWSFILGIFVKEILELGVILYCEPWFPKFCFKLRYVERMLSFGIFLQGGGVLNFLHTSITPLIAGTRSGSYAVGLLDWGAGISSIPESIANNFSRVAFSGFAKIQHDIALLTRGIEKSIGILSIFTLFFALLIFGFANEGVRILYTDKWAAGIPALYWFTASTFFVSVMAGYGQGILALGRSKDVFSVTLLSNAVGWIIAYVLVLHVGYIGVAIDTFIFSVILFILYAVIASRIGISVNLIKILLPKLLIFLACYLVIIFMNIFFEKSIIILVSKMLFITSAYFVLLLIFEKEEMRYLGKLLLFIVKRAW